MSVPPEVLFDRAIHERGARSPDFSRLFRGRAELSEWPEIETVLHGLREDFNRALGSLPDADQSPFYFDYIESTSQNALAFCHQKYSFIGITVPLLRQIEDTSKKLCAAASVRGILSGHGGSRSYETKPLWATLVRLQLLFAVAHEYGHHRNGDNDGETILPGEMFVSEIEDAGEVGSLDQQLSELSADGIATYFLLSDLLLQGSRPQVIRALKLGDELVNGQDRALLVLFVVAVAAFFLVRRVVTTQNLRVCTHPPPCARVKYFIHHVVAWCSEFRPVAALEESDFRDIVDSVSDAVWGTDDPSAKAQTQLLSSELGKSYLRELDERFHKG